MPYVQHNATPAQKRAARVRAKMFGTADKPRVTISRSNKYIYLQAIDDATGKTLASSTDAKLRKNQKKDKQTKTQTAALAAAALAEALHKAKITQVIFDRGQYKYHGRVKAVAQQLRTAGVKV